MIEDLPATAEARFGNLTQAERFMLMAAPTGGMAVCSVSHNNADALNNPANSETWDSQRAIRAEIIQWLCCDSTASPQIDKKGIHIYAALISGTLDLSYTRITFPLTFERCAIADKISFKNGSVPSLIFKGSWTRGILADAVDVATNVLLNAGFHSQGEIVFRDARVGGSFRTDGGTFENPGGMALGCDRMRVGGTVLLSTPASSGRFSGEVRFAGASIGSNLEADGGSFINQDGPAITADRITAGGGIFLRNGFSSTGEVRLLSSAIGAVLDCRNGAFSNPGKIALHAENAHIGSSVMFDGDFRCSGSAHLFGAIVGGGVSCQLAKFTKLDLRHANIAGPFRWTRITDPGGTVLDLRNASIGSIEDDQGSWPSPGHFYADGLKYEGFHDSPTDVESRLRWIRLDESGSPQAYRQLADVYSKMGETRQARQVLYVLEELLHNRRSSGTEAKFRNPFPALWSFLLKWTIGYGYKLGRAGAWMLLLTIIGIICSCVGYSWKVIVPTEKEAFTFFDKNGYPPASYARFSSFMYSIEHSLPAINLGISSNWSASTAAEPPHHPHFANVLRWWFCLQTLLAWGLSIFFIAGITGLVKSDR